MRNNCEIFTILTQKPFFVNFGFLEVGCEKSACCLYHSGARRCAKDVWSIGCNGEDSQGGEMGEFLHGVDNPCMSEKTAIMQRIDE